MPDAEPDRRPRFGPDRSRHRRRQGARRSRRRVMPAAARYPTSAPLQARPRISAATATRWARPAVPARMTNQLAATGRAGRSAATKNARPSHEAVQERQERGEPRGRRGDSGSGRSVRACGFIGIGSSDCGSLSAGWTRSPRASTSTPAANRHGRMSTVRRPLQTDGAGPRDRASRRVGPAVGPSIRTSGSAAAARSGSTSAGSCPDPRAPARHRCRWTRRRRRDPPARIATAARRR